MRNNRKLTRASAFQAKLEADNLASHIFVLLRDREECRKTEPFALDAVIHTIPARILVSPSTRGDACLVSWFFWGRPAGNGILNTTSWHWSNVVHQRCAIYQDEHEAIRWLEEHRAQPA